MNKPATLEITLTPVMAKQILEALKFIEDELQSGDRKILPDGRIYHNVTIEDQDKAQKAISLISIIQIVTKRHQEIEDLVKLDKHIDELNESVGLNPETLKELKTKISSRVAQCEISIRDHSKLLNDEY